MDQGLASRGAVRAGFGFSWLSGALLFALSSPAEAKSFVLPHVLEKSGTINNTQFTFDTDMYALYGAGLADTMSGGGATVDLYLFDESERRLSNAGVDVCGPCTLELTAAKRKQSIRLDDFVQGFEGVKLGYGILVVGGADPDAINLQGFVVNSHTGPFDLSFHGMAPTDGDGGGGNEGAERTFVLPHVIEKSGRITNSQFTFDTTIFMTYTGGFEDGSRPPGATVDLYLYSEDSSLLVGAGGSPVCGPCTYQLGSENRRESLQVEELIEQAGGFGPLGLERGYGIVKVGGGDPDAVSVSGFVVNSHAEPGTLSYLDLSQDELGPDDPGSSKRTFVIPHVLEKSGSINNAFSFDTVFEVTYAGGGSGLPGDGAAVEISLFDDTGSPLVGAGGTAVCDPCAFPLGAGKGRLRVTMDQLIEAAGGFETEVETGFAVVAVTGDADQVSVQGFVVNSHASPLELSFLNLDGTETDDDGDPDPRRTFVLPHMLEKSGRITDTQFTFDTTIFATYTGGLAGGGGGGGATLDLYLYDDATGSPMTGGDGTVVCNPCNFELGSSAKKLSIRIDDLITAKGAFDQAIKLGYGVIVVGGADPGNVALQGFVVNSHTSAFDLSFASTPVQLLSAASRPPRPPFRRGDPNESGDVDLSDAIYTLGCLFIGTECPKCPDAADSNDDGMLDLSDGVHTLQYLFSGGEAPPAPGPDACGEEPDDGDQLEECVYSRC